MSGRQQKDIRKAERARENYPPLVLLERCPECGAEPGEWCRKVTDVVRRRRVLGAPHPARFDQSRLGKNVPRT